MMRSLFLLVALLALADAFRMAPVTTRVVNQITMKVENDAFARYVSHMFVSVFHFYEWDLSHRIQLYLPTSYNYICFLLNF